MALHIMSITIMVAANELWATSRAGKQGQRNDVSQVVDIACRGRRCRGSPRSPSSPVHDATTSSYGDYGVVITPHESALSGTRRPRDTQRIHAYPLDGRPDTDQWERPGWAMTGTPASFTGTTLRDTINSGLTSNDLRRRTVIDAIIEHLMTRR